MTKQEIKAFIDEMKPIGDEWTEEQVEDVYGKLPLAEALVDRKASIGHLVDGIGKIINS